MKTAMILAAGRGERLQPLTSTQPKALCLVGEKPLLAYHLAKLAQAGFEHLVINHAYLGSQIRHYVNALGLDLKISLLAEPPGGLETGGGVYNALPLLGTKPFLTVNADIFTDYDFSQLCLDEETLVKLVLIKKTAPHPGDFGLDGKGRVINQQRTHTFAGIACYHPKAFVDQVLGRYSLTPLLRKLTEQGAISGEIHQGTWFDVGSLAALAKVNAYLAATGATG